MLLEGMLLAALLYLFHPAVLFAAEGPSVGVGPTPSWVTPPPPLADEAARATTSLQYLWSDEEVLVRAPEATTHYHHVVRLLRDEAGVAASSEIQISFDPAYETLTLHHVRVVRSGRAEERLDAGQVQIGARESDPERHAVDSRLVAVVTVKDLRAGDWLEYDYSITGANPAFAGHFVLHTTLAYSNGATSHVRLRILAPKARLLSFKSGPEVHFEHRDAGADEELLFQREAVPELHLEPRAPESALVADEVDVSEFTDWADVARWGDQLFGGAAPGPAVAAVAAELYRSEASESGRALAALQYVQSQIRTVGNGLGPDLRAPTAPDDVLARRYGDSRDKTALLVALLRAGHLRAAPALVSTRLQGELADALPSPLAFDRALARVDVGGATYWLDSTKSFEAGGLEARQTKNLEEGLVLAEGTQDLSALPSSVGDLIVEAEHVFTVDDFRTGPTLTTRLVFHGDIAELVRSVYAERPAEFERLLFETADRLYPHDAEPVPATLSVDPASGAVVVTRRVRVPGFFRLSQQKVLAGDVALWWIGSTFAPPATPTRRLSYYIARPGRYRESVRVVYPEDVFTKPNTSNSEGGDAHMAYRFRMETTPKSVGYSGEVEVKQPLVAPAEWSAFSAQNADLLKRSEITTVVSAIPLARQDAARARFAEIEGQIQRKQIGAATLLEEQAALDVVVLDAVADGGRLSPRLEGEVERARGVDFDALGRYDEAKVAFDRARALTPDDPALLIAAALNAWIRGQDGDAVTLAGQALVYAPNNPDALLARGRAEYFQGQYARARDDLRLATAGPGARRDYAALWLYLASQRSGEDAEGELRRYLDANPSTAWPRGVLECFAQRRRCADVLASAQSDPHAAEQLTEAYFYLGEKEFGDGDKKSAAAHWRETIDLKVVEFVENAAAHRELARLGN